MDSSASNESIQESADLMQLLAVVVQCFGTIFVGYVAGRIGLIGHSGMKGFETFVLYFSLPCLIFLELSKASIGFIDWSFVLSVLVAKCLIFLLVVICTLLVTKPMNCGKAGLYGIICSQSNDFAIGYPLLSALYSHSQPHFPDYLYVFAPLQLAIINPIGFFLMELENSRADRNQNRPFWSMIFSVVKRVVKSPMILMTLAGLLYNAIFGPHLPEVLSFLLRSFADSFSATVLFLLGVFMVGKFESIKFSYDLHIPCILTVVKLIIFPMILRFLVQNMCTGTSGYLSSLKEFGFLYGTIPIAPTVFIFSVQYDISSLVASTALIISTFISSPLMFVSANMIRLSNLSEDTIQQDMDTSISIIGLIALGCGLCTLVSMLVERKWRSITHRCTILLLISQTILALGGFITRYESPIIQATARLFSTYGIFSCRLWTMVLALTLVFAHCRSICFVLRFQNTVAFCTFVASLIVLLLTLTGFLDTSSNELDHPNYIAQCVLLVVLSLSLISTLLALIFFKRAQSGTENERLEGGQSVQAEALSDSIEDIVGSSGINLTCSSSRGCSSTQRKQCASQVTRYLGSGEDQPLLLESPPIDHEILSHLTLLIYLVVSMTVELAIIIENLLPSTFSGILLELEFLDAFTNYGQAICTMLIFSNFGVFSWYFRRSANNYEIVRVPRICEEFKRMYLARCSEEICFTIGKLRAFKGYRLISWLTDNNVVNDRASGMEYVECLVRAGLVVSLKNNRIFTDTNQLYRFQTDES